MEELRIRPAEYSKRLAAYLIDAAIISVIQCGQCYLVTLPFEALNWPFQRFAENPTEPLSPLVLTSVGLYVGVSYGILSLIVFSLYSALLESSKLQATIGKRVLGLYVSAETGARLSFKQAMVRAIIKYFSGFNDIFGFFFFPYLYLCGLPGLLNIGMIFGTEKHQGLHDMLAHTLVVERQAEMPEMLRIDISNSQIGILNAGEMKDIQSITTNVSTLVKAGHAEIVSALEKLTNAVIASQEISLIQRSEMLEQLEELSRQAALPPEKRAKSAVLKSILGGLASTMGAAGSLAEVWSTWGTAISKFFGL